MRRRTTRLLAALAVSVLGTLGHIGLAVSASCPPSTNSAPPLQPGGNVFGSSNAQWMAYFQGKLDANNGTACNLNVTGSFTYNGAPFIPLGGIWGPSQGGTGVNNGVYTITLGGSVVTGGTLTTSGAFATSGALTFGNMVTTGDMLAVTSSGNVGQVSAATARSNLGLGTMATQNASAVAITGGTIASAAISGGTISGVPIYGGAGTSSSLGLYSTLGAGTSDFIGLYTGSQTLAVKITTPFTSTHPYTPSSSYPMIGTMEMSVGGLDPLADPNFAGSGHNASLFAVGADINDSGSGFSSPPWQFNNYSSLLYSRNARGAVGYWWNTIAASGGSALENVWGAAGTVLCQESGAQCLGIESDTATFVAPYQSNGLGTCSFTTTALLYCGQTFSIVLATAGDLVAGHYNSGYMLLASISGQNSAGNFGILGDDYLLNPLAVNSSGTPIGTWIGFTSNSGTQTGGSTYNGAHFINAPYITCQVDCLALPGFSVSPVGVVNALGYTSNGNITINTNKFVVNGSNGSLAINGALIAGSQVSLGFAGSGSYAFVINDSSATNAANFLRFLSNGTAIGSVTNSNNTGVLYNVSSDERLKHSPFPLSGAGALIDRLHPVCYTWNNGQPGCGFYAQEEYADLGEMGRILGAVTPGDGNPSLRAGDSGFKAWQRSDQALIPLLVADIKDTHRRLERLEAR